LTTKRVIALSHGEAELADELRKGSSAAFERLYREQGNRMKSIAANLLGNRSDAEDAVHDAFIKVFRASAQFDGRCPVEHWAIRILVNTCHDRLRQRRPTTDAVLDFQTAPREDYATRAALKQAIALLPERHRTIFLLYDVEGLRHSEISSILDEPEGTVRGVLFEARKKLRAILRPAEAQA
jgi:RNA polymerase sigma-70 factor (ECF subfamily)